ncbi:glutathione S-transferase family protein [Pseudoroseomonas globiformis]|uniref:Glutathione S-transferase family protein n=1 Tax=Teichococcus globiformis TaxID=2307229 RepID=A0ABV7G6E1_9PROT
MSGRRLYELAGADPARRFSPYCWRARMALAHKGLEAEAVPWRFTDSAAIAFSGQNKVPVLVDGSQVVSDSWNIACYLEDRYPDRRSLFQGGREATRFTVAWADTALNPALVRLIVSDIPSLLDEPARAYFVESREKRFGMALPQLAEAREAALPAFQAALAPLRAVLKDQAFLGGASPDYGDYAVFGSFQWARVVSSLELLLEGDRVADWRDRMLDLFNGLARATPARGED